MYNSQSLIDELAVFKKPNWSETEKSIFKSLYGQNGHNWKLYWKDLPSKTEE